MELTYQINKKDVNSTINSILINELHFSTRLLKKLINKNCIYLNNDTINTRCYGKVNDIISVSFDYKEDNSNIIATPMQLDIIYEDDWLLILNKPAGIAIHPSLSHYSTSLSNGVKYYFDSIGLYKKIRPVNRLDFYTSGLVIFAKCEYIQECLSRQMSTNNFKKEYLCLIDGIIEPQNGYIELPIARKEGSIIERCIDSSGQYSKTIYNLISEFDTYSLVHCILETGRTHQIRVHFSFLGHPLLGDTLYGQPSPLISHQALHSYQVSFIHPITNKVKKFTAPLPYDFKKLIK